MNKVHFFLLYFIQKLSYMRFEFMHLFQQNKNWITLSKGHEHEYGTIGHEA